MLALAFVIFILLSIASAIIYLQPSVSVSAESKNNKRRISTWWIIFGICFPVCFYGGWYVKIFIYALLILALFEINTLAKTIEIKLINSGISLILLVALSNLNINPEYLYSIALTIFLFSLAAEIPTYLRITLAAIYICVCLESLIYLYEFANNKALDSGLLLFVLLFISAINDIAQYIAGRIWGRHKLWPFVSPNKTIQGAVGGVIATTAVSTILLPGILHIHWLTSATIGLLLSVLGIAGDFYFSRIKRQYGVKDSGTLLPGHGGVLDRIDSIMLMAPGFGWMLILLD